MYKSYHVFTEQVPRTLEEINSRPLENIINVVSAYQGSVLIITSETPPVQVFLDGRMDEGVFDR